MKKPILAVDMDEVLADSIKLIIEQYNRAYGTHLKQEDLFGKTIYDCLPESHLSFIKQQQNNVDFYQEVSVIEGAKEGITILSEKYDIYIVSAALEFPNTLASRCFFVEKNFPEITWRKIIFCVNKPLIRAEILIDDMLENLQGFGSNGYLFTAYHNSEMDYSNRLNSWEEIVAKLG